jgi:endonuclease/exonuclease/phosphatase family metal-dependent hydrolase
MREFRDAGWTLADQVQEVVTELLRTDPDVIFLQECPTKKWAADTFPDYTFAGARRTHAGYTSLLLKPKFSAEPMALHSDILAVMAKIQIGTKQFVLASVHLEPFGSGSFQRQDQVQELMDAAGPLGLLFAGDCNMRDAEDEAMEKTLHLTDVWKEAGSKETNRYSWDTEDHGEYFKQYYGESTRQYRRRYDRIYVHGATIQAHAFALIANTPIGTSKNHFLSDHFGLTAEIGLS